MALSNRRLKENNIKLLAWDEIFEQVPQWNRYYISNYGRLIHSNKKKELKLVPAHPVKAGYLKYCLSKPARMYKGKKLRDENGKTKGQRKNVYAHRLVASLYVNSQYPEEFRIGDLHVHHKDGNPANNYSKNLMYTANNLKGRYDHDFIHDTLKDFGSYNEETGRVYRYKDIERLCDKAGVNLPDFIDYLKYGESEQHDKWQVYTFNNGYHVAVKLNKKKK